MTQVIIKTPEDIQQLKAACRIASELLDWIEPYVQPGVSTEHLDELLHSRMTDRYNVIPAPLNYQGFPKATCMSVNEVICHGIPNAKLLKDGDIINIDVTVIKNKWHGDTSRMFRVGKCLPPAQQLCRVTREALYAGIEQVKPGNTLGDVGYAIQSLAHSYGYSIVQEYCGHGIGKGFHEAPQVLHYGRPHQGLKLEPGMTFTIEPMINIGKRYSKLLNDGWTVITKDGSLSAQWEHTLAVTETGYEILTVS